MNIYYYCNHPYPLVIMESIASIFKDRFSNNKNHLIFVKHPYFDNLDYKQFFKVFDGVSSLPWINYEKNIFNNIKAYKSYIKKLRKVKIEKNSLTITISYSDLATNIFCNYLKNNIQGINLVHFTIYGNFLDISNGKFNLFQSFISNLNVLLFNGRYLKIYTNSKGVILDRIYFSDPHDKILLISHSDNKIKSAYPILPFPIAENSINNNSNDKLIFFFADSSLIEQYKLDPNTFYKRINILISALIEKYRDETVKLIYKPHPLDDNNIPNELKNRFVLLFNERLTAEMIFLKYRKKIKAIYSISSLSCLTASFLGIPSYVYYPIFGFNKDEKKLFKQFFTYANRKAFVEMNSLEDIGKVDNYKDDFQISENHEKWIKWLINSSLNN